MPQAVQADWNLIREMYTNGLSCKEISAETGVQSSTIACRASRGKWQSIASKAKAIVKLARPEVVEVKQETLSLSKQSSTVRDALGRDLTRLCELLETAPAPSLSKALKRQQDLEPVVRNAKTVFGWSEGQAQPSVRIAIMGSTSVQVSDGSNSGSTIDVESSKVVQPNVLPDSTL